MLHESTGEGENWEPGGIADSGDIADLLMPVSKRLRWLYLLLTQSSRFPMAVRLWLIKRFLEVVHDVNNSSGL